MKVNAIRCRSCTEVIWSRHRHDMRWCSCGKVAIDGGREYTRILGDAYAFDQIEVDVPDVPRSRSSR